MSVRCECLKIFYWNRAIFVCMLADTFTKSNGRRKLISQCYFKLATKVFMIKRPLKSVYIDMQQLAEKVHSNQNFFLYNNELTLWKWQAHFPCKKSLNRAAVMLNVSSTSMWWYWAKAARLRDLEVSFSCWAWYKIQLLNYVTDL